MNSLRYLSHMPIGQSTFDTIYRRTCDITRFALRYFDLLGNFALIAFGARELFLDLPLECRDIKKLNRQMSEPKLEVSVQWFYQKILSVKEQLVKNSLSHGTFYLASGVAGTLNALHQHAYVDIGAAAPVSQYLSLGLFLAANIFMLDTNINIYCEAEQLAKNGGQREKALAHKLKISSVMGIINSLGYILATIFTLFSGPVALAIAIGALALCAGATKIIYDFLALSTSPDKVSDSCSGSSGANLSLAIA